MKTEDYTRANTFDKLCGYYQTLKSMELGVGDSILDIGCGWGEYTHLFTQKFERVVGMDPEEELLEVARKGDSKVEYIAGWGETFNLPERFDTISMNNLLEHVDDPVALLKNCKRHLAKGGVVIAQVPNANSDTRYLGYLMGIIDDIKHISDKERDYYGHQRSYLLSELERDFGSAGLSVVESGSIIYKPLPNEHLWNICQKNGEDWTQKFVRALYDYGSGDTGGYLYVCAK